QNQIAAFHLGQRKIDHRQASRFIGAVKFHAPDYADDIEWPVITCLAVAGVRQETLSDRVFTRKESLRQGLINNHHRWRLLCIVLIENSPAQKWRSKGREIVTRNRLTIHVWFLTAGRWRRSFAEESCLPGGKQGRVGTKRDSFDPVQGGYFFHQRLETINNFLVVTVPGIGQIDSCRH